MMRTAMAVASALLVGTTAACSGGVTGYGPSAGSGTGTGSGTGAAGGVQAAGARTAVTATTAVTPAIQIGKDQQILGPSGLIDSVYATVRGSDGLHAYMSNSKTVYFRQLDNGTLVKGRTILSSGPKGSVDQCGVHPIGAIYKASSTHWVTFYHGERANPNQFNGECNNSKGERNQTRWSVLRLETTDGGKTWAKGGQVLRQDDAFMHWSTDPVKGQQDDAGSPRMVIKGNYLYLFYRAVNAQSPDEMQMSVARATLSSLGKPGSWYKYDANQLLNKWGQKGLGGSQSTIDGLPATARGISWNSYLQSYLSVRVSLQGMELYVSDGTDLHSWHLLQKIAGPYGTESGWNKPCVVGQTPDMPIAVGYGATIGWDGSSNTTGQNFWIYYMKKPVGKCFSERLLLRRQVSFDAPLRTYPKLSTKPGPPQSVYATRYSGTKAKVTFKAGSTGNAKITSFQASCVSTNGGRTRTKSGTASPLYVSYLTNKRSYKCRVRATNIVGTGNWSSYSGVFRLW